MRCKSCQNVLTIPWPATGAAAAANAASSNATATPGKRFSGLQIGVIASMLALTALIVGIMLARGRNLENQEPNSGTNDVAGQQVEPNHNAAATALSRKEETKTARPEQSKDGWQEFVNKDAGFRVRWPEKPFESAFKQKEFVGPSGSLVDVESNSWFFHDQERGLELSVGVRLPLGLHPLDDRHSSSTLSALFPDDAGDFSDVMHKNYLGRERVSKFPDSTAIERGYVAGSRYYHIKIAWRKSSKFTMPDAKKFLDSFQITYVLPKRKDVALKWLPVRELRTVAGFAQLKGSNSNPIARRYVCVTGVFPMAEQRSEFARLPKDEFAMKFGQEPNVCDLIIERQEVVGQMPDAKMAKWEKVDLKKTIRFLRESAAGFEKVRPADESSGSHYVLTSPLPKLSAGTWGKQFGHSRLAENNPQLKQKRKYLLVRFVDFFVRSGHSYRYRLSVKFTSGGIDKEIRFTTPVRKPSAFAYVAPKAP